MIFLTNCINWVETSENPVFLHKLAYRNPKISRQSSNTEKFLKEWAYVLYFSLNTRLISQFCNICDTWLCSAKYVKICVKFWS